MHLLQNPIKPTQNAHRQDYIGIAAPEEIAQNIVGDAPKDC